MRNILSYDREYEKNIEKYNKKDGFKAILLYIIFIILYSLLAILQSKVQFINDNIIIIENIMNLTIILITVLFVVLSRQKLHTIGIVKGKWKKSVIIGLLLAFIFFMTNFEIDYLMYGGTLKSVKTIIYLALYYLIISFCEEIVFRGYIQTRIHGIINNKLISILVVAFMFTIMHFPYRMIVYGSTLNTLMIDNFSWCIQLFIMHVIWNYIYTKTNSIYASIISHWISNFAASILL